MIPDHRSGTALTRGRRRSARPLAAKLLERPRLIARIRGCIPDPRCCHLVPYTTTTLERDLALLLGIPM